MGAFESLNSRFLFFQAPWHIYKRMAEASWQYFAPLFLADLWLSTYQSAAPGKPSLKYMIPFFIVLHQTNKEIKYSHWSESTNVQVKAIGVFLKILLPLVRFRTVDA